MAGDESLISLHDHQNDVRSMLEETGMPQAEARIETPRSARYLAQLCTHLDYMHHGALAPHRHRGGHSVTAEVRRIQRTDDRADIEFDWGRCVLSASVDALMIEVGAEDDDALARGQELIARRIETIGRRELLTVAWQRIQPG